MSTAILSGATAKGWSNTALRAHAALISKKGLLPEWQAEVVDAEAASLREHVLQCWTTVAASGAALSYAPAPHAVLTCTLLWR